MKIKKIIGSRLILRPVLLEDSVHYFRWFQDPEAMRFFGQKYYQMSQPEVEKYFSTLKQSINLDEEIMWSIELKNGSIIGGIGIQPDFVNQCGELWILIGEKEYWCQGYGREALQEIMDHLFMNFSIHRLEVTVTTLFEKAIGLYESLGFKREGIRRHSDYNRISGNFEDEIIMGILKDEWEKN